MKTWLKGGLIGICIFTIFLIVSLIFPKNSLFYVALVVGEPLVAALLNINFLENSPNVFSVIIGAIIYFIIGAIIGAIIKRFFMKNIKLGVSLSTGVFLLLLPFLLAINPLIYGTANLSPMINYLLPVILIPVLIYFIGILINKIKENNGEIFWGLLISFIASGSFLLHRYGHYLSFGTLNRVVSDTYSIFPNFLFPSLSNLLSKSSFFSEILFQSYLLTVIIDLIFVFIIYFIIGIIIGWIVGKIKSKKKKK